VFSVPSVPRLYEEGQLTLEESLKTAVTRVGVSCGTVATGKNMSTEAEDIFGTRHQATTGENKADREELVLP
jgi:hypothetical protein